MGVDSKMVLTGKTSQNKTPKHLSFNTTNKVIKDISNIAFCYFHSGDIVKNKLAKRIVQSYENFETF
jgi:phosphate starvation-inducible protein PhoH